MDTNTLLFAGFVGIIISYVIIWMIIRGATRADESIRLQQIQIRMLSRLLQEKGVTNEEVEEIINV